MDKIDVTKLADVELWSRALFINMHWQTVGLRAIMSGAAIRIGLIHKQDLPLIGLLNLGWKNPYKQLT